MSDRPPSIYSMANGEGVIFVGSFSKSIAPALRVGYIVAKWDILSRILGLKQDAGSGALEQMVLAKHEQCDFIEVNELDETERGAGGYGHTGVK